ncbi:DUF4097 family beta strand repeat-containing protein [Streptomyces sp. NPDC002265]|uniref:DUF4097 family beta strand repeat-containing protein n=1 Tax=Streptomyces sp. NPDC002265 TaxID=3154415 RepID=UPI00331B2687
MQKFATPAPVRAVLDIPAGRIRVVAADRDITTVEVLPADASKSRDVKTADQIQIAYADGILCIHAPQAKNRVLGHSGAVEVTVHLPAGSDIEARAAAAELRAVGRLGDVVFEGAHGSVELDEAASARLTGLDAAITVGRLNGPGEISTQRGDVAVTEAVSGTLTLATQQGDIAVGAARGVAATLDAGTAYGRIHNTLTNTASPAGAALAVKATTAQGDITARSL